MTTRPKPVVLVVLDGWGEQPPGPHNAIHLAQTPMWDHLTANYPFGVINASELHVGLPEGQMGNSEVGHMNIGSGRVVMQELPRIDAAIASGALAKNPALQKLIASTKPGSTCHLMGLLSPGGVHAHQAHIATLYNLLKAEGVQVKIHAFLDGRDTPPQSALEYLKTFFTEAPGANADIATVSGRYYAMDRDKRWDRVERAFQALALGQGERAEEALTAVSTSYEADVTDEFMFPTVIGDYKGMQEGDTLLMANFRADRARELLSALIEPNFNAFPRDNEPHFTAAVGMVEYSTDLSPYMATLFGAEPLTHLFGEIVSDAKLTQLRVAETEKYAHVTFFFNGGREEPFPGEERILIPSAQVATYDLKPEMSAFEVTDALMQAIEKQQHDVIIVNYANTDMVGHSGNLQAAMKAVEAVDACLSRLVPAVLNAGGALLITADHGNAEHMHDEGTGQPHTAHTLNLVPVLLVENALKGKKLVLSREGRLADVAPTLLAWLKLPQPQEMTGRSLLGDVH